MTHAELDKLVEPFMEALGEHADSIQLLMTWNEDGNTHRYWIGSGNWYARKGLAMEWLEQGQAQTQAREISEALHPPEDD